MSRTRYQLVILFSLLISTDTLAAGVGFFDGWDPNDAKSKHLLVLARVVNERDDHHLNAGGQMVPSTTVDYAVTVLRELNGRLADNASITIHGNRSPNGGSNPKEIPLVQPGTIFVIVVQEDPINADYIYAGDTELPIGIKSPASVEEKDCKEIERAFGVLADLCKQHDADAQHDKAIELIRDPEFYSWSLGAYLLAREGTTATLQVLLKNYTDEKLTLRQALWLDHLLGHVMPSKTAPTTEERHQLLLKYLSKHELGEGR